MHIREAADADRPAIEALIRLYPDQLDQINFPATGDFLVAEEEGIVGCCAIEVYSPKIAEIRSLAVLPERAGKGIATALVEQCVERAKRRGVRQVLAITSAVKFFDKLGFQAFHEEKYALLKSLK